MRWRTGIPSLSMPSRLPNPSGFNCSCGKNRASLTSKLTNDATSPKTTGIMLQLIIANHWRNLTPSFVANDTAVKYSATNANTTRIDSDVDTAPMTP